MKTVGQRQLKGAAMFTVAALFLFVGSQSFDVLPVPLETPPFEYTYNGSPPSSGAESLPVLKLAMEEPISVTDVEEWFDRVVDDWPAAQFHEGGLNSAVIGDMPREGIRPYISVPGDENLYLDKVINSGDVVIALYGNPPNSSNVVLHTRVILLLQKETFKEINALDFLAYSRYTDSALDLSEELYTFQWVRWAEVRDGVLYVCNMHWTYAESSAGRNAYITALDLETNEILWRTAPLVCNSQNFIISEDAIFCGYGFTAEDDYVYVLNRLTGEVIQSVSVHSAPEYFWKNGDTLYVRCYNRDCVFTISS